MKGILLVVVLVVVCKYVQLYLLVRFVTGMSANVLLQMRELGKLALTDLATIRFDTKMNPSVL